MVDSCTPTCLMLEMNALVQQQFTVEDALVACGVSDTNMHNEESDAQRMATDLFNDDFTSAMDKTFEELDEDFKTYSNLTQAQGQIRINPGIRRNIKAFVQWCRDQIRVGQNPAMIEFPVDEAPALIRRYKSHLLFVKKSSVMVETARPKFFKQDTKWIDWKPTFVNFLKVIPGRDGVPLSYVVRDNESPIEDPSADILDDYVNRAPLDGEAFKADALEVHMYLVKFISENTTAESKILMHASEKNGRKDFMSLMEHYEGVGIHAIDVTKAEEDMDKLFYSGEKKPHMWWEEFERRLTMAFAVIDKREKREVYSNNMKLRILVKKVNADFLSSIKASINVELTKTPMTMTYEIALMNFRNEVNSRFPPEISSKSSRRINQVFRGGGRGGRGGRGNNNGGRGGRNGGRGRGNNNHNKRSRSDAWTVTGRDGSRIDVHPAYKFTSEEWDNLTDEVRAQITRMRSDYSSKKRNRQVKSVTFADGQSEPAEETEKSIMGGRNEQASLRTRRAGAVRTVRVAKANCQNKRNTAIEPAVGTSARNEMDTNADTCCLGCNFVVLNYTFRSADVYPYDESSKPLENVPIVTGATAWTDPDTNETIIFVLHESLYYGTKLSHSLMNPNQLRYNGLKVYDDPFEGEIGIKASEDVYIPLTTRGTRILFESRAPSQEELTSCRHVELTSSELWEPSEVKLGKVKSKSRVEAINGDDMPHDSSSDSIIYSIEPSLIKLKEMVISSLKASRSVQSVNQQNDDVPARRTFVSNDRHQSVTAEALSEAWMIGPKKARATLMATTQRGVRSAILPLSRRYRADRMLGMKRLNGKFATDFLYADIKSLAHNIGAQVFTHKCGFAACYPLPNSKGDSIGDALLDFSHDFGVPEHLTFDGAQAQVGRNTKFMQTIKRLQIRHHVSAPRRPNENPAEGGIREIKRRWYRVMIKKGVPARFWDYALVWVCETSNLCVSSSMYANGRTPIEIITGETPDISEYLDFGFYDWVVYRTNAGLGELSLGRWLGVSHKVGQLMSYWIATKSGHVISCTTVQRLTNLEATTDEWIARMLDYDEMLKDRLNANNVELVAALDQPSWNRLSVDENDEDFLNEYRKVISDTELPDADQYEIGEQPQKFTPDAYDGYINMEIGLHRGEEVIHAKVKRRAVDDNLNPIGVANANPLLDSRVYEVELPDGTMEMLSANVIAENLLASVDEEGHRQLMMDEIIDHRTDGTEVKEEDGFTVNQYGTRRRKMTTRGWELLVSWKDGSSNWVSLKDLKESYPVEVAQYAKDNKIDIQPAFAWWVPHVRKKTKAIIQKLKSKYWQRTHKYGIRIPKSVEEAIQIDKEEGNTFWQDAIREEMLKVHKLGTFQEFDGDVSKLVGYQQITLHMIFDVKLGENFRRKARLVADGHRTNTPSSVTYSSVVSRDSVRICLLIAALNGLDIKSADIENAYLTAPCREKIWVRAGHEFGSDQGKVFILAKALYGLKSSGASFRATLAKKLDEIGFKPSEADPDVWLRPAIKPDGEEYYEYILVYVDDILCISMNSNKPLEEISKDFKLKNNKICDPEIYLGGRLEKKRLNGNECWTLSSRDYVKAMINSVEERIKSTKRCLPARAEVPMSSNYYPELDGSPELENDDITLYQEIIGMLRWAIEIGRTDILFEVSILSAYQCSPREGHLEQLLQIISYLKKKPKLTLYFDPELPKLDSSMFPSPDSHHEFREHYRDAEDTLPERMPKPRGRMVYITAFVDASHAANKVTRKSHTGFLIFVNRAPIIWYSKRQMTVESSTFSSEFIAMKVCVEHIQALRFKLRMFGIPISDPTHVLCDNNSVVNNSSKFESTLEKKHSSIAYHAVRWAVAAGVVTVGWINTVYNLADAFTKRLTAARRSKLFGDWTY